MQRETDIAKCLLVRYLNPHTVRACCLPSSLYKSSCFPHSSGPESLIVRGPIFRPTPILISSPDRTWSGSVPCAINCPPYLNLTSTLVQDISCLLFHIFDFQVTRMFMIVWLLQLAKTCRVYLELYGEFVESGVFIMRRLFQPATIARGAKMLFC